MYQKIFETKTGVSLFINLEAYTYKVVNGTLEQVKNALRTDQLGKDFQAAVLATNILYVLEDMDGSQILKGIVTLS